MPDPHSFTAPDSRSPAGSETVRAIVTVVLAVYLTGLGLGVFGDTSSGTSALVRTVKGRLFSPWLVPAWLDLGFDHRLTYGAPDDADHVLELARHDGRRPAPVDERLRLPGNRSGEQAARWRRLARAAVQREPDSVTLDPPFAAAVARGSFALLGGEDVSIRVLRWPLPDRLGGTLPAELEPVASGRVRLVAGDLQFIAAQERVELAPLARPAPAAVGEPQP